MTGLTRVARFRSKIDRNGPVPAHRPELGPCWLWTGTKTAGGYGQFWDEGRYRQATHVALELDGRPVADDQKACHHCDNPPCVRPSHLFGGTFQDNVDDMMAKGRHVVFERTPEWRAETAARTAASWARLTPEQRRQREEKRQRTRRLRTTMDTGR